MMYGSDYPVALMAAPRYHTWVDTILEIVKDWSEEDKNKLFSGNVKKAYRF